MSTANAWGCRSTGNGEARPFLKPGWSPFNIFLMVIGFIVFWPLGLAMLAWNIWGHRWGEVKGDMKRSFAMQKNWARDVTNWDASPMSKTGNVAFDEYRSAELARLEEERKKLDEMRKEFDEHLYNLRKARDQQEFDSFMNARSSKATETPKKNDDVTDV